MLIPFLYGEKFRESVEALLILVPGIIAMTVYMILHSDLTGRGRAKITVYIFGMALILNIVLNLFLIPRYGINGAAFSSTISYSLGACGLLACFAKMNSIPMGIC